MANGSVYVDASFKSLEGNTVVMGRTLMGNADEIRADELGLDVIQSIIFQPFAVAPVGSIHEQVNSGGARIILMQGSLGSVSSRGSSNYVSVRSWPIDNYRGDAGTLRVGTLPGSVRSSFIAAGY